jgi:MFS family permease
VTEAHSEEQGPTPLRHDAQFRHLLVSGLLASLVRWLDVLSFGVFAYQQTQSAFWVASMMLLRMLPMGLFGLFMGALASRIPRRSGLLVSQGLLLATTLVLLLVAALDALQVWHLAVASFISGVMWAGDLPMRRGLIGDVVGPPRISQAMALDAVTNNGSRLVGPVAGGLLLGWGGMTAVLAVDALLYVAVLASLARLDRRDEPREAHASRGGLSMMLLDGWRAVRESPRLRATLCITILFNIFCWPVMSMVPVIAQERLGLSTQSTGLLAGMDGLGSLLGAVGLVTLARRLRHGPVYVGGTALFLSMLPVFALSTQPWLTGAALLAIGAGQAAFAVMQSTLVILSTPPERRAQALGLVTMCIGIAPLGFLLVGALAERIGAPGAALGFGIGGLITLALTWRVWRPCVQDAAPAG